MNSRLQFVHDRGLKQVVSFPEYHVTVLVGISGPTWAGILGYSIC